MQATVSPSLPALLAPLNDVLAPLVKAGLGSPLLFSPGVTVLEVAGRRTGVVRSVPLTCFLAGPVLIVGTVRSNSQWLRNLAAAEDAHVWLWGRRWSVDKQTVTDNAAVLTLRATVQFSLGGGVMPNSASTS